MFKHKLSMVKTITITDNAYESLKRLKIGDDSFSDVIKRISKEKKTIKDFFGILGSDNYEEMKEKTKKIRKELDKDAKERMKNVFD